MLKKDLRYLSVLRWKWGIAIQVMKSRRNGNSNSGHTYMAVPPIEVAYCYFIFTYLVCETTTEYLFGQNILCTFFSLRQINLVCFIDIDTDMNNDNLIRTTLFCIISP